jgi:mono/diheme cytochrome c family protein
MPGMHVLRIVAVVGMVGVSAHAASAADAQPVDFARDVKPILSEYCFTCHGPDEKSRAAKLRLDLRDHALKPAKSGAAAIVPGKPETSELVKRITTLDEDDVMPPPDAKKTLSAAQVDTLKRWIAAGAEYRGHWAFEAPRRSAPPPVSDHWARNDVDRFVVARLDREGLRPSPEADRAVLLRRLSLDLVGLPPTPAELDAFVNDPSPNAYDSQVDRLLASPHFGEKWARHWMDAARYADSDGYEKDLPRSQWVWRDWLIDAINRDLPYDQFVIEQVAGDLLPGATQAHRIATGFLRNGMVNEEGAIINEQFRMEGLIDRMDAIGKSVLGLTVQCAQCHTHKYDPITHDEYYRLLAYLNNDYEATNWVYNDAHLAQVDRIQKGVESLEAKVKAKTPDWPQRLAAWEAEQVAKVTTPWDALVPIEHEWVGGLAHPETMPDRSILTLGFRPSDGDLWVTTSSKQPEITGLRLDALTHGDLPFGGPGRSVKGTFAVSELIVEAMPDGVKDAKYEKLKLVNATADFAQSEQPIPEFFRKGADDKRKVGPATFLFDGDENTAWGSDRGPGRRHQDLHVVAQFEKPIRNPNGTKFKITLRFKHAGGDAHGRHNNFLGRFRLATTTAPDPKADPLPRPAREALAVPSDQRTPEQQAVVFAAWRQSQPQLKDVNEQIEKLWASHPEGETVLNVAKRSPEHARQTFLLDRGDWQKPSRPVSPGTPAFLHPLPDATAGPTRLTLAKWLVDPRSPTTARVAVNRVWQSIFGVGLVETSEDFGVRAAPPSHPELLDWLAVDFTERGWSTKRLIRTIVTSAAYRQSSKTTPALLERDPANRLLARGPRFRADAEVIRDVALAAGGLLNPKVGGPSVFPPVPDSLFALSYLKVDFWQTATGPERYRRSLYTFRRRSMPDPVLSTFDAPTGDTACARRVRSNTPLAALASMNETVFVEAAQSLALRTLREAGRTDAERAAYAFRLCTGRAPGPAETAEILALLASRKAKIGDGWLSPREITTGDPARLPPLPDGATPTDAAAWTIVSRVLLNLDETLTKN